MGHRRYRGNNIGLNSDNEQAGTRLTAVEGAEAGNGLLCSAFTCSRSGCSGRSS